MYIKLCKKKQYQTLEFSWMILKCFSKNNHLAWGCCFFSLHFYKCHFFLNIAVSVLPEVALCLPDRPCPSPADFTTRQPPLSTPECWHWPRLPLRQPAHVHHWPISLRQCRHPSTDQSSPAALRHHNCSGHHGWSFWAGYNRFVTAFAEKRTRQSQLRAE